MSLYILNIPCQIKFLDHLLTENKNDWSSILLYLLYTLLIVESFDPISKGKYKHQTHLEVKYYKTYNKV